MNPFIIFLLGVLTTASIALTIGIHTNHLEYERGVTDGVYSASDHNVSIGTTTQDGTGTYLLVNNGSTTDLEELLVVRNKPLVHSESTGGGLLGTLLFFHPFGRFFR